MMEGGSHLSVGVKKKVVQQKKYFRVMSDHGEGKDEPRILHRDKTASSAR